MSTKSKTRQKEIETLESAYKLISKLYVYPAEIDRERVTEKARSNIISDIDAYLNEEAASLLEEFLDDWQEIDCEYYIDTLELSPPCPLYLGDYEFEDPKTCRDIGDAERNQYMVELNAIYEDFGYEIEDELPDFVPAMTEFLGLTVKEAKDDNGLRNEFGSKMLSMLPTMIEKFEKHGTPYFKPLKALEKILRKDMKIHEVEDNELEQVKDQGGEK